VNAVCPTGVATPMTMNAEFFEFAAANPSVMENVQNPLHTGDGQLVAMVEASDVSNAMLYLCADSGRYVTGTVLPVDAGIGIRA
jgi:NAD(P)-dependent dehydrogenase (short-subunit alcohol dehydrogenase family)